MTILESMQDAYLLGTGKSTLPTEGSAKYNRLFNFAKRFHRDWQYEPGMDWNSLFQIVSAGTVTESNTFDLDTEIIKVSQREGDFVRIVTTDSQTIIFNLIPASNLYSNRYNNCVAKVGNTLVFSRTFTTADQEFGGSIEVPAFAKLDDITAVTDDVLIDNPDWLSSRIAAQFVLSDAQLSYQYPDLIDQANELMTGMKLANGSPGESYSTGINYFSNSVGDDEC